MCLVSLCVYQLREGVWGAYVCCAVNVGFIFLALPGIGTVNASVATLAHVLRDTDRFVDWNESLESAQVVTQWKTEQVKWWLSVLRGEGGQRFFYSFFSTECEHFL